MARHGIYIGNRKIIARYIGDKLVWRGLRLLHSGNHNINYDRNNRLLVISGMQNLANIKTIEINGHQIGISQSENRYGTAFLTFSDSVAEFERKTGFQQYRSYYGSVAIKIFGG